MEYEIYDKKGNVLNLNQVDEELCRSLNNEVDKENYSKLFNDLTFIGAVSINKDDRGFTTPKTVKQWVEDKSNPYDVQTIALVSYLLTYKYDIKSWR